MLSLILIDGVPELLLGTIEGLKNSAPNSIFL